MKKEWTFDNLFHQYVSQIPGIGKPIVNYYKDHEWFRKFTKFVATIFLTFWLVKAPLIWILTTKLPDINLLLFIIPSYIFAAFVVGVVVTVLGFLINHLLGVIEWKK